ncbi:MAG: DUF4317 domain-containing protein [Eubacterium sp.]|nr:DUF4317 domain-containing protein [Eubacterium sp.]
MIKKEINEIKALFDSVQDCGILKLAGCYVNAEKEKVKTFNDSFYNIPEEEMYKYLEIFRKTLSGTPGKNLLDMSFVGTVNQGDYASPQEADADLDPSFGKGLLKSIKKSELQDQATLDLFYDKVIETYNHTGNYLILMIYQNYDVPGVTSDGIELFDSSEEIYGYVLCSICPMKMTKPGLGFDDELGEIHTLRRLFAVELPETGFLYPAFNDRSSDEDALLYYCKKTDILQDMFLEKVLGVSVTLPAKQQKEGFTEFVKEVLGEQPKFETVMSIQENLNESAQNKKSEAEGQTVFFDKDSMRNVFEKSGVSQDKLEEFDKKFNEQFDMKKIHEKQIEAQIKDEDAEVLSSASSRNSDYVPTVKVEEKLFADNVAPAKSLELRNANMVLRINSKHANILGARVIDGKKCLVIELVDGVSDDLTVNGIPVRCE